MEIVEFLKLASEKKMSCVDRAIATVWYMNLMAFESSKIKVICSVIEEAGFGQQNQSRLTNQLKKDRRIIKEKSGDYKINTNYKTLIDQNFLPLIKDRPLVDTHSLLPESLFGQAKGYIKKVVVQINLSYDYSLYDCCCVMCRRLMETLIIETYETDNRSNEIKDTNNNFLMFSDLLSVLEKDSKINLGRNAKKGLSDFKTIGDLSAHNRRFNANKDDIDKVIKGLRVASEELLILSNQGPH